MKFCFALLVALTATGLGLSQCPNGRCVPASGAPSVLPMPQLVTPSVFEPKPGDEKPGDVVTLNDGTRIQMTADRKWVAIGQGPGGVGPLQRLAERPILGAPLRAIGGLLALHNAERSRRGLSPLVEDAALTQQATAHAQRQASAGRMHHSTGGFAAENVAYGQPDDQSVTVAWMNSPGHRANILGPYTRVGFGVATGADGRQYWAAQFGQ